MAKVELKDKLTMTFEQINPCERKYSFVIDQEAVTAETSKVLRMFANSVVIPGFRKGKAPASIIQTKYTEDVKEELKKHIVSTAVQKAIGDDKDKVIGVTEKNGVSKVELGAEYKFDLTVYYNPSITLPQYKGLTVELAPVQASDEEVNQRLDYMRQAGYRYVTVEGAAQAEDMLKVSYTSDFALPDNASASLKRQVCSDSNWLWLKTPR
jgi:trigger factor